MKDFNGLPNPHFEKDKEITQEQRDDLMHFNTVRFHHCFYNTETKALYNEYCIRIMDDAKEYLLRIGLLDCKSEQVKYFE